MEATRDSTGCQTACLVLEGGTLVATGDTEIDNADVFELIDAGRR